MIYVDEREPVGELESQFGHRKVRFRRTQDARDVFEMIDEIGRGKFGRVMKCRHHDTGEIFAAKFVTCTRREDRRNVEREVEIMNLLKGHQLLQLYEAYDNGRSEMCLITEYIGGGELFDRVIEDEFVLSEKACCIFTKQILEGVSYIHRQQIIHLDLKPENILCLTKSGNRIKIIDFGLARRFEPMKKLQILFGTPEFVAPEVVNFEPIGYSTDMWALGVITYVLVSGLSPFMGDTDLETMANVTIAEYDYEDEAFDNVSSEAKDFIDSLLVKEQTKRVSAEACLQHPWLQTIALRSEEPDEGRDEDSLSLAKDNLNQQKAAWNNRDSNYYLFDSKSRTASQLYEPDMPLSITARMVEQMECQQAGQEEEDQFSFFTSDGLVRRDSQLVVMADGKIGRGESPVQPPPSGLTVGERKRSLEDIRARDDTIEYIGLVKRPKTPLITAGDILKQAQTLSERKASACGSLPDIVSSSVDTTELHASRCSLLGDTELPEDGPTGATTTVMAGPEAQDLPLPDILTTEEEVKEPAKALPPILIEEAEDEEALEEGPACQPIVASPQPAALAKDYTVEEGFERPWEGAATASSVAAASCTATACDSDEDTEPAGDRGDRGSSSGSSSLPSESSGIFYRAEYTPHPSHQPSPAPGLLSVGNRDSYWNAFFRRCSPSSPGPEPPGDLRKSSSGGLCPLPCLPAPGLITKSKSDAKVNYSEAELPASMVEDIEEVERFPNMAALRGEIVTPRKSLQEVDVRPWTERSSGRSPETSSSRDNLSSTISQEMQDLLSSIQSLGKAESGDSATGGFPPRLTPGASRDPSNGNVDFDQLMAEVESQIRFSATAELLERMAACPAVEHLALAAAPPPSPSPARPPRPAPPCTHAAPDVPDLLRAALEPPPAEEPPPPVPALPSPPTFSLALEAAGNRRGSALQRPSDMPLAARAFTPTGRVPDMRSRVSPQLANYSNIDSVREDLCKVRSDIDDLRESLYETKSNVAANSRDILARCSFYTEHEPAASRLPRLSGSSLQSDLAETSSAMKEIERTVNSFTKQTSLPTGKADLCSSPNPRRIFAGANQGSVTKTKDRFEQRTAESKMPVVLTGPKPRCTTPFSKTRSPSPAFDSRDKKRQLSISGTEQTEGSHIGYRGRTGTGTRLSLRKRSPSPVVTGKVSSFRNKFENSPTSSPCNNNSVSSTVPRSYRPRASPFRERISPPNPTSHSIGGDSGGRLPAHFVPLPPSAAPRASTMGRAQSLRSPRLSLQHGPLTTTDSASLKAASFLRSTLPRKSLPETPSFEATSKQRSLFGYNRI